jgi:hypothetical protein
LSLPARTCGDDRQEPKQADDGRFLWRIVSGMEIPDTRPVFDSADEPRPGARCNSCACATASRPRAARKFSDVELEGNPPGVILYAIDFREAVKRGADGANCCTEPAVGVGSNVLKFPVDQYERLFTTYGRFNMSHFGT